MSHNIISKNLLIYKIKLKIAYCIVLHNILHKTNNFLIDKKKAILLLIKLINRKKYLFSNILNKKDSTIINK